MDVTGSAAFAGARTGLAEWNAAAICSHNIETTYCKAQFSAPKNGRLLPPRPVPGSEPPTSCFSPVTQPSYLLIPSGDWDGGSDYWCNRSVSSSCGSHAAWLDADPLSPNTSPPVPSFISTDPTSASSASSSNSNSSDDFLPSSFGRRLGVAGYFSAWLKGQCPGLIEAAEPMDGIYTPPPPPLQNNTLGLTIAEPDPGLSPDLASPGSQHQQQQEQQLQQMQVAGPAADGGLQAGDTSPSESSLASPDASDYRGAPYAFGCSSSYESGRSFECSLSLLSWEEQSHSSSTGGCSGDMVPELGHEDDDEEAAEAEAEAKEASKAEQERKGGSRLAMLDVTAAAVAASAAAAAPAAAAAADCLPLRVVECDVWERELEEKLATAAAAAAAAVVAAAVSGRGGPLAQAFDDSALSAAAVAPCDLASLVRVVVTEALFDSYPDAC